MAEPVVHLEIIGRNPARLRDFYGELFGWSFDTSAPISPSVSDAGEYGFTAGTATPDGSGVPGGIGGGPAHEPHVMFYVGVADVEASLARAEALGGTRRLGPEKVADRDLVIGQFTDPEGNLLGVASSA